LAWQTRSEDAALVCGFRQFALNRQSGRLEIGCVNQRFKRLAKSAGVRSDNGVLPVSLSWCRLCPEFQTPDPPEVEEANAVLLDQLERERWGVLDDD
jgi:hypothetical protein